MWASEQGGCTEAREGRGAPEAETEVTSGVLCTLVRGSQGHRPLLLPGAPSVNTLPALSHTFNTRD